MTSWLPETLSPAGPVYLAIADALARDVDAGVLEPGTRLPTHRALARRLGVNVVTVTRAYAEAARRGLVNGEVGRGTFVRDRTPVPVRFAPLTAKDASKIDFHFNVPVGDPTPKELAAVFEEFVRAPGDLPLAPGYVAAGLEAHRVRGTEWIERAGLAGDPERTLITCGAQQGLSIALSTLLEPGDVLLTEALTYPGIKGLASVLRLRTAPVDLDADGLVPEALDEACRRPGRKALYCAPTMQNPTGAVMPAARREALVEVARRHGLPIVEDDVTGFLCETPPPPLAALAPELVTFVTSLSKSISHGLRIGYLLAPRPRSAHDVTCERMSATLAATTWMTPPLMAEVASRLIASGRAEEILERKRREMRARWKLVRALLGERSNGSPADGSFLWLSLPAPWRTEDFVLQADMRGVAVTPASTFAVGRGPEPHAVRVCYGTPPTRDDVERGLRVLARILARQPDCGPALV